jgi:3-oxoadipate enol-lactonase
MYATVNGVRLAYSDRGRDFQEVMLLVHGFPLNRQMWGAQLTGLSGELRVVAPDLRGQGDSQVVPGPYTMDQHADDLAALLDHLGIERVIVAGMSMGGYVAFSFWRRYPERLRALALLDTRAEPDSPEGKANREASAVKVRQTGAEALARDMMPRLMAPENLDNATLAGRALAIMAVQPVEGIVGALLGMRDREDSRPILPTIRVPVLTIAGEKDQITPPDDMRTMTGQIPNASLVVIPRAGHLSPLENPRAVNVALRRFARMIRGH